MNRTAKCLVLLASLLVVPVWAFSQVRTIQGIVVDASGQPVVGAYVYDKADNSVHSVTGESGEFTVNVDKTQTLTANCLGYKDSDIAIENLESVTIVLEEDMTVLDETVVIGYGFVKKSDLTGAVASVNSGVLSDRTAADVSQILEGRMAGVYVVNSGNPQEGATIKIRGLGTVNNSSPLIVIDGVPMVNMSLNSLNAGDIETIDVLKDASATAIYGARGANGVVIVTTKKGQSGEGTVTLAVNQGVAMATSMPKLLDASGFAALNNEMMAASGNALNPLWATPETLGKGTDWLNEMISPAHLQKYSLTYSGGDEKNTYYVSGSYTDHDGIIRSVGYKKATFQVNLENKVKEWLKFTTNITFSYDDKTNGDYSMGSVLKSLPVIPLKTENGEWGGPDGSALWYGDQPNQVGKATVNQNRTNGYNFLGNESMDISIWKGLKFKSVFSAAGTFVYNESFRPAYNWKPTPLLESERYQGTSRYFSFLADNYFTYDGKFGKSSINAMLGSSLQWGSNNYFNGQKKGFLSDSASQFNNGNEIESLNGSRSDWSIASFMGRVNYSYADRYMVTATLRYDGSSKFGPRHRWGLFPSFAAAWRVSEEPWFPKSKALSYLKLRLGYGVTGNQEIGDYTFESVYGTGQYSFNGNVYNTLVANKLSNPDVHWEQMEQYNVGVDFSFLDSRLRLTLDGYIKNTNGMLVKMTVPISTGYSDTDVPYTNEGKVRNTGLEITLSSDNFVRRNFSWSTDFNISFNKNMIVSLSTADSIYYNDSGFGQYFCVNEVGQPIGAFIGWMTNGLFQTAEDVEDYATQKGAEAGDIRFKDLNGTKRGDGIGNGVIDEYDRTILGYPQPKFMASLNNTFRFYDFDAELYLQGVYGNKIFNVTKVDMTSMNTICNQYASVSERWNGTSTSNSMPRAVYGDPNNNTRPSDRYMEDGSYLRIKNLTLGYTLPERICKNIHLKSLRFYLEGTNLFTFTKYTGFDPEVGADSIDWGTYPITRTVSLGIDLKF